MLKINNQQRLNGIVEREIKTFLQMFNPSRWSDEPYNKFYHLTLLSSSIDISFLKTFKIESFSLTKTKDNYIYIFFNEEYEEVLRYVDPID